MANGNTERIWKKAMLVAGFLIIVGFGGVIFSLIRWQVVRGEELKGAALGNILQSTELTAMRGTIYDASGDKILAQSSSVWTVVLEPNYIFDDSDAKENPRTAEQKKKIIAAGLAPILDMEEEAIYEKASQKVNFSYLKRRIETDVRNQVLQFLKDNDIDQGVYLIDDYKRYYKYGTVASIILGHTGAEGEGQNGIEYQYNDELSGTAGRLISAKNAWGTDMPFQYEQLVDAEDGNNLVLTIDETVQSILEKHLQEGIDRYVVANGAIAILMDVNTGAIVGLASKSDYDPNSPSTIQNEALRNQIDAMPETTEEEETAKSEARSAAIYAQWRNKAVSDTYYPGSVFKIITGSMALNEGVVTENSLYTCTGHYDIAGVDDPIKCWKTAGHGTQTFRQGLMNSCNPFFINIGQQVGPQAFYKYFEAFGFAEKTGIDLPGETGSLIFSEANLTPINLAVASMGQNFGINPIQMITATAAVANGGYLVQPHVVDRIVDNDGNIISKTDTSYKRQVISKETSALMADIMKDNASGTGTSTAGNGYVAGYRISGKTGTSEKMDEFRKHPERGKQYIASYCGFAPADNPQYALLVFFDEPQYDQNGSLYGGNAVAGPIFASIMEEVLPYLNVKAQYTEEEFDSLNQTAPSVVGKTLAEAYDVVGSMNLNYRVVGDSEDESLVVSNQIPQAGEAMPNGGTIYLYTQNFDDGDQQTTVPDFFGSSLSDAEYYASINNVQIITSGSGKVITQSIESGESVPEGSIIELKLADDIVTETYVYE
ncbi:penicillin-binding transpeptidase domain-containing protein [Scatolibacter rhodanostii]|uniref:penicillin-binding transpeptidase domain-containing protein n=1 Tax=Scatolibacter rhodanostii TaxID=2014781 RepID=UPI000C06FA11|nr:penicillin-binding transpeptidase domain-containing protein [Scatolibacter rhodanostii]